MKQVYSLLLLTFITICFHNSLSAQSVLDPNDPVINYDPANPPKQPDFGDIGKWVRTKSLTWNSDEYKAYIYKALDFRLKFPKSYDPNANDGKKYPIVIIFHGGGEAGPITDNETPLYHGGLPYMNAVDNGSFDGYVMFPQSGGFWGISSYPLVIQVIEYMIKHNKLDPFSISVNGLSSGGQASWEMLLNYPNYISASLPMSNVSIGYKDPSVVNKVKFTPMWNFQGQLDGSPSANTAQEVRDAMLDAGANYRYSEYPNIGHNTWDYAFAEPDFIPFIRRAYSANPWPLFGRTGFCKNDVINVTLGLAPQFDAYEWRKDGVLISGATGNTLKVTALGTYDARVQRNGTWSDWSHIPVSIHITPPTVTPPITVSGLMSNVIVSGDGKNYVNLEVPDSGYTSYKWRKVGSDSVLGTDRIFTANQPGEYTVAVTEKYGCSSIPSAPFAVINALGANAPDAATNLIASAVSNTQVALNWQNNPHPFYNETWFEIYRGTTQNGAYSFVGKVPADSLEFTDSKLSPGTMYYYEIRAVNNNGAAAMSNIASVSTLIDKTPPTAPGNLTVTYSTNTSIGIQWDSSTDNVGVTGYQIYINGLNSYLTTEQVFAINGLEKGKLYKIYVKAVDSSGNTSTQSNLVSSPAVLNGLIYKYYEGNWVNMPNFNTLPVIRTGVTANIDMSPKRRSIQYAFLWQGTINVPIAGKYKFGTNSSDGSIVWLNTYDPNATPVVNNDGYKKRAKYRDGGANLEKGTYPISIGYFQNKGAKIMELYWTNEQLFGDTLPHIIEDKYFRGDYVYTDTTPVKPANISASPVSYDKIKVMWGNVSNETAFQIYRCDRANGIYQIIHTTTANTTQYVDSGLSPSTRYYYRVNAVNSYGTSPFSDSVSQKTLKAPDAPNAPLNLAATALSSSAIKLTWTDADTAEINYQVYRSVGDNFHFKLAAVLPANSNSFTDVNLYGNVKYFYKVNAVGALSVSPDKPSVFAITLNSAPAISNKFTQKVIRYGVQTTVQMVAKDSDADPLTFYASNLPSFAGFVDNGNGTATITFNPSSAQQGTYDNIKVFVKDGNQGVDSNIFKLTVNDNYNPVIDSIADYTIAEGNVVNILLNASDQNASDVLTWSVSGLPASYSIIPVSNGHAKLQLNPGYTAAGIYTPQVTVSDGKGGTATVQFNLIVNDKDPNVIVYMRFKDADAVGQPWNDITSVNTSNLKDFLNRNTSMGLSLQTSWFNVWHEGPSTGNNSGVYPDNVLKDYYYFGIFGGPETVTGKITGLDTGRVYTVSFYAGSNYSQVSDNGTTIYTIGSQSIPLAVQNNTKNTADFNSIKPASDGTITFTMSKGANTPVGYVNAIVVKSLYADTVKPAAPTNLVAQDAPGKGVQLTWNDVAYNETKYYVYRSLSTSLSTFKIVTSTLPFNTQSYIDTSAAGNTQYYYIVRAVNNVSVSLPSNIAGVVTSDRVPKLSPIANITIKNNQQRNITVTATDDASDHVTLTASNLPSFVTFTDNGNGTGLLAINPTNGITGSFENITITATDNSDSTDTDSFNIFVTDQSVNSVYVNFSDGSLAPSPWNNFTSWPVQNSSLSNLTDDNDSTTAISLKMVNGFQGTTAGGMRPGNGRGVYPEVVMRTGLYEGSGKADSILISGLSRAKKYNFVFFNSHDDGLKGKTNFTINSQTVSLNATHNINTTAQINGIVPNTQGQVFIKVSKAAGEDYAYLNSLIIQSYDSSLKLLAPADLRVTATTKSTAALQWADRSFDETGFEIWRSSDSAFSKYSLLKTVGANVTSYTDANLDLGHTYYYTVRAIKSGSQSGFCNAVAATTYSQIIYVNFTYSNNVGAPWNNTSALPDSGIVWDNFVDDTGVPTGIGMEETSLFSGLYGAGMNTGNNSGIFPDKVLVDSYGLFPGTSATMKVTGLNLQMRYDLTFFASSQAGGDVNTSYIVNGQKIILNTALNIDGTVTAYDVVPDQNGEINITIAPNSSSSQFGLIGALIIQEHIVSNAYIPAPPQTLGKAQTQVITQAAVSKATGNLHKVGIYPNPFNTDFTISIASQKEDDIQVELYTINGNLISRKNLGHVPAGSHNFKIFANQVVNSGVYILKIIYTQSKLTDEIKVLKQ